MTDQADETIVVRYVVEAQDAIARAKEFRTQVDSIKTQLKEMAASSGQSFKDLAVGMQQAAKSNFQSKIAEIRQVGAETKRSASEIQSAVQAETNTYNQLKSAISTATKEITQSNTQAKASFSSLAVGIGAALGISAINLVRNFFQSFINYCKEAIQSGYELAKGLYQINVGVNALRRAGTDITFIDVLQQLQKLKSEFGIFATKDLVVGASAFLNLNRDMGFTKKQLFDLQEAVATLAVVNGRAMDEVQKTVALALSSGYTEGLQRLGVSINRVTIAEEAARLGYAKSYMALTEQQRALATYNLILEKTAVYSDDLLQYQKTLPGAIDATTAAITDATSKTGQNLLDLKYLWGQLRLAVVNYISAATEAANLKPISIPELPKTALQNIWSELRNPFFGIMQGVHYLSTMKRNWEEIKQIVKDFINDEGKALANVFKSSSGQVKEFLDSINKIKNIFVSVLSPAITPFYNSLVTIKEIFSTLGDKASDTLDQIAKKFQWLMPFITPFKEVIEGMSKILYPGTQETTPPEVTPRTNPILTDEQISAVENAGQRIIDIQTQYDIDRRDLAIDLQRDLAQIEAEGQDKLVEIDASHAQKMLDIANKTSEQIRQAGDKYALDVQQAWDDYYSNVSSAAEKHTNKLLKIEEDYQEKLLRIKEGFMMDLEGALEQRDARQVLRLIKQYNLDRTQATRERDQNLKEEERGYKEQLNELNRQRNDRLKKLKEEFELRTAELIRQRDRELALEIEAYTKKRLEQQHQNDVDRGEREQRYQEDLDDLDLHLQDRIKELSTSMIAESKITANGMQMMFDTIKTYIGPGGATLKLYDYFVGYAQAAMAAAMGATAGGFNNLMFLPPTIPSPATHAKGGIEVANKPTTAVFGDEGTEVALFLPLRDLLGGLASGKNKLPQVSSGKSKDKMQIEVLLSPDLEGRIVDKTLSATADVVLGSIKR